MSLIRCRFRIVPIGNFFPIKIIRRYDGILHWVSKIIEVRQIQLLGTAKHSPKFCLKMENGSKEVNKKNLTVKAILAQLELGH